MQFQFQSNIKSFEVKSKDGNVLKTYYIDIGKIDVLKKVLKTFDELKNEIDEIDKSGFTDDLVDNMIKYEKDIVNILLENDWDILWEEAEHNVFMMHKLIEALIELVNKAINEQKAL